MVQWTGRQLPVPGPAVACWQANRRTYTDDQLRQAVAGATNWSCVMVTLGKTPGSGTQAGEPSLIDWG